MAKKPTEDREEEGQEVEEKPKKSKKLIIIVAAVVVVLIIGGVGAFFALKSPKGGEGVEADAVQEEASTEANAEGEGEEGAGEANLFPLETFIVNLQVKGSFLKTDIQLEFASEEDMKSAEKEVPRLRDTIIQILSSKTASDILTSEGKKSLRMNLDKVLMAYLVEKKLLKYISLSLSSNSKTLL